MSGYLRSDVFSFGEVILRLDPGDVPVRSAPAFHAWQGVAECNVAGASNRALGRPEAVLAALVDNEVGGLVEDLMWQGGVNTSHVVWVDFRVRGRGDRAARNDLNFTEIGFGPRAFRGRSN